MCGIVAIWGYGDNSPSVDREELRRIRDYMVFRGPDGEGEWYSVDQKVGLGHRRLSIIDLSDRGAQPMISFDKSLVITFNGEIYNYQCLRESLEKKGYSFLSQSDTEVILYLYREYGQEMVHHLRGMFAFAIWDEKRKGLFAARDPFGIKPLYYADDGKTIRAASQVKALLGCGKVDTTPEPAGYTGFFLWGHVPGPYTFYKGIRSLPAGHTLWVDHTGKLNLQSFCNIADILSHSQRDHSFLSLDKIEAQQFLRSALLDSVKHHLIADVPVGIFLSSGLDSTTLLALASEVSSNPIHTITLGFKEYKGTEYDETILAERVAERYDSRHQTVWISKADFKAEKERLIHAMDQPTTDGVNTYLVSKVAAESGLKVALSGIGGDELFGGYPSFKQIPKLVHSLKPINVIPGIGKAVRLLSAPILKHFTSPKYAGILEYGSTYPGAYLLRRSLFMPWEISDLMDRKMVREGLEKLQTIPSLEKTIQGSQTVQDRISALEMTWYMRNQLLRDADWAGMAHSLEIRTPLVDIELLKKVAPLFLTSKVPEKRDMAETPLKKLPQEILNRKKTGFAIPVHEWLLEANGGKKTERGLRGWAKNVYAKNKKHNILVLVTDAFGGRGGIALYNRHLLNALCGYPQIGKITAIPRMMSYTPEEMPANLEYVFNAVGGKLRYLYFCLKAICSRSKMDLIICSHLHLLPFAYLLGLFHRCPVVPVVYGIEAWKPSSRWIVNYLCRKLESFISIRRLTARRLIEWARLKTNNYYYLPNCIDESKFGVAQKSEVLIKRYNVRSKSVVMTAGRLDTEEFEKRKGFDEVLEVLPILRNRIPNLTYLIMGDGNDKNRLIEKAKMLGVQDSVVFTGYVSDDEKAAHYRLADVFAMPGSNPMFDRYPFRFVFLEALACGVPVVGCRIDDRVEKSDPDSQLIIQVDPNNKEEIIEGILTAFSRTKGIQPGLERFYFSEFRNQLHQIVFDLVRN